MSKNLIERLRSHSAVERAERLSSSDESDAPPPEGVLERDLMEAALSIHEFHELSIALGDDLQRTNRLLHQAGEELGRYREWANQVRYVAGAGPAGAL